MVSKLAVWSLISIILIFVIGFLLSIIVPSLFELGLNWIFLIFYLIPLVLGIKGLVAIKRDKNLTGKGFAVAGIILSLILIVVGIWSYFL